MKVSELIGLLKKCDPNDIVMMSTSQLTADDLSVDDVLIGSGTLKGFVFLAEEPEE